MARADATLTAISRARLGRLIVEDGWAWWAGATMFMVSPGTARKRAQCYRHAGVAEMAARSSRPRSSPNQIPAAVVVRCRIYRSPHIDRVTGEPLRPDEHDQAGSLIHGDVMKFGNISDGGGWCCVGNQQGGKNKATMALRTGRSANGEANIATACVHTVIDDHSRAAYGEVCSDE